MDNVAASWQDFLDHAELSDVGLRRSNNQDSFGFVLAATEESWQRRGHLFMVADGMGAHAAGELASKMAVDTVSHSYHKLPDASAPEALRKAISEANHSIHSRGEANRDFRGMGTTCSALLILPQGAVVGHVGDSRVYRLRGNRYEQLSADHSLVWEMMANNKLTEKEVPNYIPKNIITRSLGPSESVQVDLEGPFPLVEGDTFLLCSDGLSGPVPDAEMAAALATLPPQEAVRVLVDLANLRGGPDNITVLVIRVKSLPAGGRGSSFSSRGGASQGTVHPITWIVLGVLALVTMLLALSEEMLPALVCGVAAVIAAFVALMQKLSGGGKSEPDAAKGLLGRGPHRSYVIPANNEMTDKLSALLGPLADEANKQNWDIDWAQLNAHREMATKAAAQQDFNTAMRESFRALSFMMQEVRDQRNKQSDDSAIDIEGG
jgi:serine/threonine protein phosphatase PrpC